MSNWKKHQQKCRWMATSNPKTYLLRWSLYIIKPNKTNTQSMCHFNLDSFEISSLLHTPKQLLQLSIMQQHYQTITTSREAGEFKRQISQRWCFFGDFVAPVETKPNKLIWGKLSSVGHNSMISPFWCFELLKRSPPDWYIKTAHHVASSRTVRTAAGPSVRSLTRHRVHTEEERILEGLAGERFTGQVVSWDQRAEGALWI